MLFNTKFRQLSLLKKAVIILIPVVLLCCLSFIIVKNFILDNETEATDVLTYVENPVYKIVMYEIPNNYEADDFFAVTLSDTADFDKQLSGFVDSGSLGRPIYLFRFAGSAATDSETLWYPYYIDGKIARIYTVGRDGDGEYGVSYTENDSVTAAALDSLASLTSETDPMYLVHDAGSVYAVIGDTAYFIPGFSVTPKVDYMPEIDDGMISVTVVKVK